MPSETLKHHFLSAIAIASVLLWLLFSILRMIPLANAVGMFFVVIMLLYAISNEGITKGIFFFIIAATFGLFFEIIGVLFGVPFGKYRYNPIEPLLFGLVPISVILMWFVVTYTARAVTEIIIPKNVTPNKIHILLVLAFLDALIATSWDIIMDPVMVNVIGMWTWEEQGIYFGIPLSNYIGWVLVSYLMCLVYRLFGNTNHKPTLTPIVTYFWLCSSMITIAACNAHLEYTYIGAPIMTAIMLITILQYQKKYSKNKNITNDN